MSQPPVDQRVGFIGAGRMGTALARGLISANVVPCRSIIASDVSQDILDRFVTETGSVAAASNTEVLKAADVVILAVKPQQMGSVLTEISSSAGSQHLFVSIAAGVPLSVLARYLGEGRRLVRVMPNTPCLVGSGASAYALGSAASPDDGRLVESLLSTVGIAVQVAEPLLDAVTGLSGSGPAYIYQIIEALSDGGVQMGLPRDVATLLAAQTTLGAARMVLETGEHPGALKDAVTSPGGTTIAGLHALESGGVRACLMNAVKSATLRSRELGESA